MRRAAELNNNGVTDMKDIVKGLKLEDKLNVELDGRGIHDEAVRSRMAREQSTTIMKQVKGKDADYFRDEKKASRNRKQAGIESKKRPGWQGRKRSEDHKNDFQIFFLYPDTQKKLPVPGNSAFTPMCRLYGCNMCSICVFKSNLKLI